MKKKKVEALVLFSGGLDSILAVKILQEQGIKVTGLTFVSCFFDDTAAQKAAKNLGLKLQVKDFSQKHLALVKKPPHGYGKNMNPCIDCHALMLKEARQIMVKEKFNFVATGEVLGERPMSQNKQALKTVEKTAGLEGFLLRPLSAKLLEATQPEKADLVNREKLWAIKGRQRKEQLKLAKKYQLRQYPTPSGGCLLTDGSFSQRLRNLLTMCPRAKSEDVALLKVGRHFWQGKILFVVGRNHEENLALLRLNKKNDFLAEAAEVPGPLIFVRNYGSARINKEGLEETVKNHLLKYNEKARQQKKISVRWLN